MDEKKIIAYSFLAYLNNDNMGNGFNDIFIPLVKRTLSKLCSNNTCMGLITDIKDKFQELYGLDIPYPVLKEILKSISIEINKSGKGKMALYSDNAYCIEKYTFEDYEETLLYKQYKIERLEKVFQEYIADKAIISQYEDELNIFKFIDRNRAKLSNLLSSDINSMEEINENADVEMEFIKRILETDIDLYNTLKDIYIGSIISTYIEIDKIDIRDERMRFIVDTNFIISLLGLHSIESQDTCNKILDICKKIGYKISISDYTIDETNHMLSKIIEGNTTSIIERYRYNSTQYICDKNNITKTDLELKKRKLHEFFGEKGISIIYLKNKYKDEKIVQNGEIYKRLEQIDYANTNSILHDAILIDYVSNERQRNAKTFSEMKTWLLTESKKLTNIKTRYKYSEAITTDELVNLLWLMKPIISSEDIFKLGLNNLFAEVIEAKQPKRKIIKEIDNNIKKYKEKINDDDIIALGLVVSNSTIDSLKDTNRNYEEINNFLVKGELNKFSEKVKIMKEEQDKYIEEQRKKELEILENKNIEARNNEFANFVGTLIRNNISELQENNNKLEYGLIEINDINKKVNNNIKRGINCISIAITVIVGIILIIIKNASEQEGVINLVDIIMFCVPIILGGGFKLLISKFTKNINELVNKKRKLKYEKIKNDIEQNEKNTELLNDIQQKVKCSSNARKDIIELSNQEQYRAVIDKIQLLTYIKENMKETV